MLESGPRWWTEYRSDRGGRSEADDYLLTKSAMEPRVRRPSGVGQVMSAP